MLCVISYYCCHRGIEGTSTPLRISPADWASAEIQAELFYILLTEKVGINAIFVDNTPSSGKCSSFLMGCSTDAASALGNKACVDALASGDVDPLAWTAPYAHLVTEIWPTGIQDLDALWAPAVADESLPQIDHMPLKGPVQGFLGYEGMFVSSSLADAAMAEANILLKWHESYNNQLNGDLPDRFPEFSEALLDEFETVHRCEDVVQMQSGLNVLARERDGSGAYVLSVSETPGPLDVAQLKEGFSSREEATAGNATSGSADGIQAVCDFDGRVGRSLDLGSQNLS